MDDIILNTQLIGNGALLKTLPVPIFTVDINGYLTSYNNAAAEFWGRRPQLGKDKWYDHLNFYRFDGTPLTQDQFPLQIVLSGGHYNKSEEFIFSREDNSQHIFIPHPQAIFDADNNLIGALNTIIEVTQLRRAQLTMLQSDARLKNLIDVAVVPTAVFHGPHYILSMANNSMLQLWEKDNHILGKRLIEFLPGIQGKKFPEMEKIMKEVFQTGHTYEENEVRSKRIKNNSVLESYCNYKYAPSYDSLGKITDIILTVVDVTETVTARKKAEESEKNLRNIIEQAPVPMTVLRGPEFIVEMGNEKMFELWGKSPEDYLNKRLFEEIHPIVDSENIFKVLKSVFDSGKKYESGEFKVTLPRDGKIKNIYVNFVAEALRESDDSISGIVVVANEITEQVHARKEGELLQERKDDFLGITSHELKTPVTILKAYTQILESILSSKNLSSEISMVKKMDHQINKLNTLIVDLLDTTKINSGKIQFNDSDFNFNDLVKEVWSNISNTIRNKIILKLAEECMVHADKERITQVIENFITNASKYSDEQQEINLSTSFNQEGQVVLSVQDFGIGLSTEDQEKVFEQFYRVTGSGATNTYPGMGLGLYISAQIIEREKGQIWVSSVKGKGATFSFSLPCKKLQY